jgi:hypothetical protein
VRLILPQCLILPVTLLELTTLPIIRSHHPLLPSDRENQLLASNKQNHFNASLGPKNNEIDKASASKDLAPSSFTAQGAGSPELVIDGRDTECPYHSHILQEPLNNMAKEISVNTMERFMIHHPGEQYALFTRPDNKKTSIYRQCSCLFTKGDNLSSTDKLAGEETDLSGFQVGL